MARQQPTIWVRGARVAAAALAVAVVLGSVVMSGALTLLLHLVPRAG